ncbi:MAG: threonine synthase [Deltaproteobacteria bacterium]|nr:threonine synthase [Deltaproteobacteria bacterium]
MRYVSTLGGVPSVSFSEAIAVGPAPEGGLFVPESVPRAASLATDSLAVIAARAIRPFLEGDALERAVHQLCQDAYAFPAPVVPAGPDTEVLELFHGPTLAFKDFGARFLAACLSQRRGGARTVLVATSGDTGGAVAAAFHRRPAIRVVLLFPLGRISERQRKQLSSFGDNVSAIGVRGTFDDCQRIVKQAFADRALEAEHGLTSANSISVGRWLPQVAYFASASIEHCAKFGEPAGIVVPSGNLGNGAAACLAKRMGFPIREVVLAFNENQAVPEYFQTGEYRPRPAVATPANAMDVGDPSNFERLRWLYPKRHELLREVSAVSIKTPKILATIRDTYRRLGLVVCPHTAVGLAARESRSGSFIVAATAHPVKFEEIVEPLVGRRIDVPEALEALLCRPATHSEMNPTLDELRERLALRPS